MIVRLIYAGFDKRDKLTSLRVLSTFENPDCRGEIIYSSSGLERRSDDRDGGDKVVSKGIV